MFVDSSSLLSFLDPDRDIGHQRLFIEDYFMQMLTATALQMVHPLSPNLAYFFQHLGRHLTNTCFNVVFQCVN